MRNAILTCTALVLLLPPVSAARAQEVALFRLTDFWAYLELKYRLDEISNKSTGVETIVDDTRFQIELGGSSTSYIFHPRLLHMRVAGSLLSDRQNIAREQISLLSGDADLSRSSREDLLLNLDATFRFLKDKPYPATVSYVRDNPIVSTGVEGTFTQENERIGLNFELRDVLPFNLLLDASQFWSFGESLDRVVDISNDRVSLQANKTISRGNRLRFDYVSTDQTSRNGDPRRPIQEITRRAERLALTTNSRLGSDDQLRIDQTASFNRRDEPDVTDILFSPRIHWIHGSMWESRYRYNFSQTERPESDFENRTESLGASIHYSPSGKFEGQISTDFDRSNDVDRLSQKARGISGRANIKRDTAVGQFNLSMGLGYRLDDRVSESPLVIVEEEPVLMVGTAPVPLSRNFVVAETVIVRNATGTQTYIEGFDYFLSELGSTTRIERIISGSILDGETVLVDYEAETGGTFEYSQVDQDLSADFRFARFHSIFFRYSSSKQDLQSGVPTLPFNSVEAYEIGLREQIPLRWGGAQLSGEARYLRQDEDINPFNRTSLSLSIQAPLSQKLKLNASVSRNLVDNLLSEEDSDLTVFNANVTWLALRSLTIRAEGNYAEDTGGTILRSNTRWKLTANWRYRRVSLRLDSRYVEQRQGDINNDHFELWLQIRRDLF